MNKLLKAFKDIRLGWKLAGSYLVLIIIFILLGLFFLLNMHNLRREFKQIEGSYIPLIDQTRLIESYTNQAMYALWEYTELDQDVYYHKSKANLNNLKKSVRQTKIILKEAPKLGTLKSRLNLIDARVEEFDNLIDQTAVLHYKLDNNQRSLIQIREDFVEKAKLFLYDQENLLRKTIRNKNLPPDLLAKQHRKSRLINLVVDKGNTNMIRAFEAQVSGDPNTLNEAFRQFKYINRILDEMCNLSSDQSMIKRVTGIKEYFADFKRELEDLRVNLEKHRAVSNQRIDLAHAVLHEARMMSKEGMSLSKGVMSSNVQSFSQSTMYYFIGLLLASLVAGIFAVLIARSITIPITKSVAFAEQIAEGKLDASVTVNQEDEVGMLAHSLKIMGSKLKRNIDELRRMERSMREKIIDTEDKERQRIAEDLHDSLGPLLSTIKLYVNTIQADHYSDKQKIEMIQKADEVIDEAILSTRSIANNLLPNVLKDFGLEKAILSFCDKIREINVIDVDFKSKGYTGHLDKHSETMLFRVVKELINNTLKHAGAGRIVLEMRMVGEHLVLDYLDDGVGFDMGEIKAGVAKHGIQNIYNRIHTMNGEVLFSRGQPHGIHVQINVPTK